jgi:uncharacterized protein (UPF0276 family)
VHHVAGRIRRVQDLLGRRIAVENVSYYAAPFQALTEVDFINAVLAEADCDLLLDVNNVYVNGINHGYDPRDYIARMPGARIVSYHVAGHFDEADDLKIDTHGAAVKEEVWGLLAHAYQLHGVHPTLLERDFNFPPMQALLDEVAAIRRLQQANPTAGARPWMSCASRNSPSPATCAIRQAMRRRLASRVDRSKTGASRSIAICSTTASRACSPATSR